MEPALLVRLTPTGPWRIGPESGARDHVESVLHSDTLFSALCSAFVRLGRLDEWLDATLRKPSAPEVRLTSCFPSLDGQRFVVPPRSLWPPLTSAKVRWKGAKCVPLPVVQSLVAGENLAEGSWVVDGPSECLVPADRPRGPFRPALRSSAAVDRLTGCVAPHTTACLEFAEGGGMWTVAAFADDAAKERWTPRIKEAFRLLADSGFGGERSSGWGRSAAPEFEEGILPNLILAPREPVPAPVEGEEAPPPPETAWWLLSLFSPGPDDTVDWNRGDYALSLRSGRTESSAGWGAPKKSTRMLTEGSVIFAGQPVCGAALDVTPEGFPHPVYRAGYAVSIPIPWRATT